MEVVARHLLFLQIVQDWELPIRQKANVFLEIFGNCLVQVCVADWAISRGSSCVFLAGTAVALCFA